MPFPYNPPRGGLATGESWGGEPKGAGRGNTFRPTAEAAALGRETQKQIRADPEMLKARIEFAKAKAEREEQLIERLGDIALNCENEATAVMACDRALDRVVGKPRQVVENLNRDVTAETAAEKAIDVAAMLRGWKPPEK
jgi:hypothetical protein